MTTDDQSTVHKHAVKQLAETIAGDAATADMQASPLPLPHNVQRLLTEARLTACVCATG